MTSKQNSNQPLKKLKINKRPKDALSDDEDDDHLKYTPNGGINNNHDDEKCKDCMSIWIWMDFPGGDHYYGCLGQQSYSFAISPQDLIIAYNYQNMDKDWFLWLLKINKLSPSQFIWIQNKNIPTFQDMEKYTYLLTQIALIIEHKLINNPLLQIRLKPFMMTPATDNIINTIKSQVFPIKNRSYLNFSFPPRSY